MAGNIPPQSPNLQDLRSLVMGLLNARAMLESSFGKTEKVLDANKITQLNSGCSDGCTEDVGDDQGHDLAREAGGEVWETHGVQIQLEDDEAGQPVEMMEGVEESQDQEEKLSILKLHPGKKRKRTKKTSKHEGVNIAIKDRNKHYDSEGIYLPLFWPNPNVCPSEEEGGTHTTSAKEQANRLHTPSCVCPDNRAGHRSGSARVKVLRQNTEIQITKKKTKNITSKLKYNQYIVKCTRPFCGGGVINTTGVTVDAEKSNFGGVSASENLMLDSPKKEPILPILPLLSESDLNQESTTTTTTRDPSQAQHDDIIKSSFNIQPSLSSWRRSSGV